MVDDGQGRAAAVGSRGHRQVGAALAVAAGIDLGMRGAAAGRLDQHFAPAAEPDTGVRQPRETGDVEAEGHDYGVGGHTVLAAGQFLDPLPPPGIGGAEQGADGNQKSVITKSPKKLRFSW